MFQSIKRFIKKHWGFVLYTLFGILTTFANYLVFLPMYNYVHLSAVVSNALAWVAAVLVAFLTNKPFVFKSKDWSLNIVVPEFLKFVSCRLISGIIETVILLITVDVLKLNGNFWKLVTMILVIIINYFGSKKLVFRDKH